jgi:hypothetical protein
MKMETFSIDKEGEAGYEEDLSEPLCRFSEK